MRGSRAGERKTQSSSFRAGLDALLTRLLAVLAKPQLKLQEASKSMHVEARVGRDRALVVRAEAKEPEEEECSMTVSRLSVPNWMDSLEEDLFGEEALGWTQLSCTEKSGIGFFWVLSAVQDFSSHWTTPVYGLSVLHTAHHGWGVS